MFAIVFSSVMLLLAVILLIIYHDKESDWLFGSLLGLVGGTGFWLGYAVCLHATKG